MSDRDARSGDMPDEATPQEVEVPAAAPATPTFGLHDSTWTEEHWFDLLRTLVESRIVSWKDVTTLVLGQLNPSQVGTSLASSEGFKRRYGKGNTMKVVIEWIYAQNGRCADCGSRLDLQADHVIGREEFTDKLDADYIENMVPRCRRHNVKKRRSHKLAGITHLTAEAGLMWILFVIRPRTLNDFIRLCRLYGMTMSDIRMQESWAMAHWLARDEPPAYGIEDDERGEYDLVLWPDSAITRVDPGFELPSEAQRIHTRVSGNSVLGFITLQPDGRLKFHEQEVSFIPFSTYDLGEHPPQALALFYSRKGEVVKITGLAPRGMNLVTHAIRDKGQTFRLVSARDRAQSIALKPAAHHGRLVNTKITPTDCKLEVTD